MFIKQLYTNCLSEAAYYIESGGEAAVIDPLRDIDVYLSLAAERNELDAPRAAASLGGGRPGFWIRARQFS